MSSELSDLQDAIACLALEHSVKQIPRSYFEKMIETWHEMNKKGHDWDQSNAAAALLHTCVTAGIIHMSQLTPQGYQALNRARQSIKDQGR
ncbi:MAG: hypothetical protein KJN89_11490 [Gammaproteobacteria bacterium]|nr:hypothetical protein [Gammaproteobacteria bacterium]NNJ50987.1 hypothetical protein [Gammaproteobacteria bacterium]